MFKNSLELRLHIENLVYNYIINSSEEVSSYELGLSIYAGDPIYVNKNEIIVSESQDPHFRKYSNFDKISCRSVIDGYVFYSREINKKCLVGEAIDYFWQKRAIKNFKNKD